MREIEVKILDIDRKKVEQKLSSLGAKKTFEGILEAYYFDYPNLKLRKSGKALRLRKESERTVLTFKQKIHDKNFKIRNELEIELSDFSNAKQILELLGLRAFSSIRKKRIAYSLGEVHLEIDKYLGKYSFVPVFLEIEAEDERLIYKYAEMLGFKPKDCKPWTMIATINHYKASKPNKHRNRR